MDLEQQALDEFRRRYGGEPDVLARAPGRVNLIGEHTDYNDGFALPMGLPFGTVIAARATADGQVTASSVGHDDISVDLSADPKSSPGWGKYVHGMAHMLERDGHQLTGWQGAMIGNIPGSGLSSSAALEMVTGVVFAALAGVTIPPAQLARLGQLVENEVLGLPTGIMDQLASATAADGMASLIDCRDLSVTSVPLPAGATVVIMDTGTRRELVDSEYAERRASCERAAAMLGVPALRDATLADLDRLGADLARERRRAHHVIAENQRTLDAASAMRADDLVTLGTLMTESHVSLRDLYDVTGPALDRIVDVAHRSPGCLGARMTGGGFAGAAVALVHDAEVQGFVDHVMATYEAPAAQPATAPAALYPVKPAAGAGVVPLPEG